MRIFCFTDFHGDEDTYRKAAKLINGSTPDLVLLAGDIADFSIPRARTCLGHLDAAEIRTFYVPGNMDSPQLADHVKLPNVTPVHAKCEKIGDYELIGLGGAVTGPFATPFEYGEDEAARLLGRALQGYQQGPILLLSHCPPKNTKVDETRAGVHAGSLSVRDFIERHRPILTVSGHIHEARGTSMLQNTVLVNPGPAYNGNYGEITLNASVKVQLATF